MFSINSIKKDIVKNYDKKQAEFLKGYMVTKLNLCGLKVPVMRTIAKKHIKGIDFKEAFPVIKLLLKSKTFEDISVGLYMLENYEDFLVEDEKYYWKFLENFIERIDNWCHSDYSCAVRNKLLQRNPKRISDLKKWASSKNPWKRRAALISLMKWCKGYSVVASKTDTLWIVNQLIEDKDYYVQKAVGWVLREVGVKYPDLVFNYLKKNDHKITSTIRSTAMEKLKHQGYKLK